jgi:hypothetical protein
LASLPLGKPRNRYRRHNQTPSPRLCYYALALVSAAFADPTIVRVQAYYNVSNAAPAHVLEKAGFTCEGVLRRYLQMANLEAKPRDVSWPQEGEQTRPRLSNNYRGLRGAVAVAGDAQSHPSTLDDESTPSSSTNS